MLPPPQALLLWYRTLWKRLFRSTVSYGDEAFQDGIDRCIQVLRTVSRRDEPRFECARGEVDPSVEHAVEEARVRSGRLEARALVIRDGHVGEERREERPFAIDREWNPGRARA